MKKIKTIVAFGLFSLCVFCISCSRIEQQPSVRFFIDGSEITADTITVPLNSYLEIHIESSTAQYMAPVQYQWQYATGTPVDLSENGSNNLTITSQYLDQSITVESSSGYIETALFTMLFSDGVYHFGDLCKLRVKFASGYYEKVLNIRVD